MRVVSLSDRNRMLAASVACIGGILAASAQPAAALTRADTFSNLNQPAAWVENFGPSATTTLLWNNTLATPANANNTIGSSISALGIQILDPVTDITIPANGVNSISVFTGGIDLSNATKNLTIGTPVVLGGGSQTWTVVAGRTLTLGNSLNENAKVLTLAGTGNYSFTGAVTNTVSNSNVGAGATLSTSGTFTNSAIFISNGTLNVTAGSFVNNNNLVTVGAVNVNGGTLDMTGATGFTVSNSGSAGALNVSGGTVITSATAGRFNIGNNASLGTLNLNSGELDLNSTISNAGTTNGHVVNFNGATLKTGAALADLFASAAKRAQFTVNNVGGGGGAIIDTSGGSLGISSAIQHTGVAADGGLTKKGPNALTLSGANAYNGATSVQVGTLALASTGSINSSASINVAGGATFDVSAVAGGYAYANAVSGNGTIGGTLKESGTITAGDTGTLGTLGLNALVLTGTYNADFQAVGTGAADVLNVAGALNLTGSTLNFQPVTGGSAADDAAYVIASYGAGLLTGTFANLTVPTGYTVDYAYNGGNQIAVVAAVPEPATIAAIGLGGLLALRRRRTA